METTLQVLFTVAMIHLPGSFTQAFTSSIIFSSNRDHMARLRTGSLVFMCSDIFVLRVLQVTERLVLIIYPIPNAKQLKHFLIKNFLSVKNWRIKLINRNSPFGACLKHHSALTIILTYVMVKTFFGVF